jgi:hypothetical protein
MSHSADQPLSLPDGQPIPFWFGAVALLVWLFAGAAMFLPFASDTSPWDAVTFRVPGDQGNWWHFLVGLPFFLAVPMIWLRVRALQAKPVLSFVGGRWIWAFSGLCVVGTLLVELPFLLHLAGTSEWQRLVVLSAGLGTVIASGALLFVCYRGLCPTSACLAALNTAYLGNAALCLIVYSPGFRHIRANPGWPVTLGVVCLVIPEQIWIFIRSRRQAPRRSRAA